MNHSPFSHLRPPILFSFLALLALSLGGASLCTYRHNTNAMKKLVDQRLVADTQTLTLTVKESIQHRIDLLYEFERDMREPLRQADRALPSDPARIRKEIHALDRAWKRGERTGRIKTILTNSLSRRLKAYRKKFPDFAEVFVTDRYGAVVAASDPTTDYDQSDETWWQDTWNGGKGCLYVGAPAYDESSRSFSLVVSLPVRDNRTHEAIGVLRSTLRADVVANSLNHFREQEARYANLFFPNGQFLSDRDDRKLFKDATLWSKLKDRRKEGVPSALEDGDYLIAASPVVFESIDPVRKPLDWTVVSYHKRSMALKPLKNVLRISVVVNAIVFFADTLIVVVVAWMIGSSVLQKQRRRLEQITRQKNGLLKLATQDYSDIDEAAKDVLKTDAETLGVNRVSLWFYNEDQSAIRCKLLYQLKSNSYDEGLVLQAADFPTYFKALRENRLIASNDVWKDPVMKEFPAYFSAYGINSMMDVPVWYQGKMAGVVCHEHTGPAREWTLENQDFAASISDFISLNMERMERKKAEQMMLQASKLSALGEMAAGLAHELNNPLSVIKLCAEELNLNTKLTGDDRESVGQIQQEADRSIEFVKNMLVFSRSSNQEERTDVDLNDAVDGTLHIVTLRAKYKAIELAKKFDPRLPLIRANKNQVQQIIVNLGNNAVDAMEKRGKVTFKTYPDSKDGRTWAVLEISDDGPGIPKENQSKIFDPFFTTKEEGKGTGLGLSLVSKLVQRHDGLLTLTSEENVGTTFKIYFPLSL